MADKEQDLLTDRLLKIDLYSLIRDIIKNIWVIVLCALIGGMWGNLYASYLGNQGSTYTAETTLIVSAKGTESYVYSNSSSAQTLAVGLSNIMKSNLMQKYVCRDLELDDFTASVTPTVVDNTNLMKLRVTDKTPELAYGVLNSILDNYQEIASSVMGGVMIETLTPAEIPVMADTVVNSSFYTKRGWQLGMILAFAAICLLSILNDTIKSSQDLSDKLDAKALGTIYYEQKYKTLRAFFKHKKNSILITNNTTSFAFVESYRKITAKISYLKKEHEGLTLVITSILENEGKSTVATNTAITLAQDGSKVLLVDCDLRKPAQSLVLYSTKEVPYGLSGFLKGTCGIHDIIKYDEELGISVIMTAKETENASELLAGDNMAQLLRLFKREYDYIILDTPPLSGAADAESLADRTDASLLVVKYDTLQAADINDEIDTLSGCRAEMTGCVLNMVHRIGGSRKGYGYGYGYGAYGKNYYGSYYSRSSSHSEKGGSQ